MKRVVSALVLVVFGASVALAAPLTGKVLKVEKEQLKVLLNAKPESWIKKGAKVRVFESKGLVVELAGDTLTISTPKADKAKVGDEIKILKPRAGVAGC